MKRFIVAICVALCATVATGTAHAGGCDGLAKKLPSKGAPKVEGLISKITILLGGADPTPSNVDCSSVVVAIQNLVNPTRTGGRGLQPAAALDRNAAQAEIDSALQKAELQQALEAIRQHTTDEDVRLLLEAAVFDENGLYAARDLRLTQLREKLGA